MSNVAYPPHCSPELKDYECLLKDLRELNCRYIGRRMAAAVRLEQEEVEVRLLVARAGASDSNRVLREIAASEFALLGTPIDGYRVKQLLKDPYWMVRSSAIWAAEHVIRKSARILLEPMLDDKHFIVRRDAASVLGSLGQRVSIGPLLRRVEVERHDQAKLGLWEGLVVLGERHYLEPLVMLYKSEEKGMRTVVWESIRDIAKKGPFSTAELDLINQAMDAVLKLDSSHGVREQLELLRECL